MKNLKMPLKMLLILAAGTISGILLLCLAFLLPTSPIYEHVKNSAYVFQIEGVYPSMDNDLSKMLDNYTDSLMLSNALFNKEDASVLQKALGVYHPFLGEHAPTDVLISYVKTMKCESIDSYPRYWHGYLVFLKPLLLLTDYLGFRSLNKIFMVILVAAILAAFVKYRHKELTVPLLAAIVFLRPLSVSFSLQYSTIFYLSFLSVLFITIKSDKLKKENNFLYYFFILGIITNYLDFLTYPIAVLGTSMTMYLVVQANKSCKAKICGILSHSISWCFGYSGMWIAKWLMASVFLQKDVLGDALEQARFRLSGSASKYTFTRLDVISRALETAFSNILIPVIMIFCVSLLYGLWRCRFQAKQFFLHAAPYFLICLMPFVWYAVLQNHSFVHPFFTYRSLVVFVFAFLSMGFTVPKRAPESADAS